jgi:hypothetical protein
MLETLRPENLRYALPVLAGRDVLNEPNTVLRRTMTYMIA